MKAWQRLLFNWSAEKAWFLGVLYGDGNVYKHPASGDYRVSACGSISTTRRWIRLLDESRTPKEFTRSPGTFQAYVNDRGLVEYFERGLGICGPKAGSLVWPADLPAEFERDFIRGLWDTDGSLFIQLRRHRQGLGNDSPRAKFDSKCESFVEHLRGRLEALTGVDHVAVSAEKKKHSTWHVIKYAGAPAMKVADYLYGSFPAHLVNDDRVEAYKRLCALRDHVDGLLCPCGEPATMEGRCHRCWWVARGLKTGLGTVCSTPECGKPVLAKGLCSACYSRERRGFVERVSTVLGPCACGGTATRRGMCDKCYRAERYKRIKVDRVQVQCEFCQTIHSVLRQSYDKNIAKNGTYVCERYGGHLAGSLPKDHLKKTNPYAAEGRKQCSRCGKVQDIELFDVRKASWDGRSAACKGCVSIKNKEKYLSRKAARGAG